MGLYKRIALTAPEALQRKSQLLQMEVLTLVSLSLMMTRKKTNSLRCKLDLTDRQVSNLIGLVQFLIRKLQNAKTSLKWLQIWNTLIIF